MMHPFARCSSAGAAKGRCPRSRSGVVLFLALGATAIVGVLVVSAFFGASQRNNVASASLLQTRALAAADMAQNLIFASVHAHSPDTLPVGGTGQPISITGPAAGAITRITRVQTNLYLLATEASAGSFSGGPIRRRMALLFRYNTVPADTTDSTLVARIPVRVQERGWAEWY